MLGWQYLFPNFRLLLSGVFTHRTSWWLWVKRKGLAGEVGLITFLWFSLVFILVGKEAKSHDLYLTFWKQVRMI